MRFQAHVASSTHPPVTFITAQSTAGVREFPQRMMMAKDPQRLIRQTLALIEVSEALCRTSLRAIERSKRLLESLTASRPAEKTEEREPTPVTGN